MSKVYTLAVRITYEDKRTIEKAARAARRSRSDWCRIVLLDAASSGAEVDPSPRVQLTDEQRDVLEAYRKAAEVSPRSAAALFEVLDAAASRGVAALEQAGSMCEVLLAAWQPPGASGGARRGGKD